MNMFTHLCCVSAKLPFMGWKCLISNFRYKTLVFFTEQDGFRCMFFVYLCFAQDSMYNNNNIDWLVLSWYIRNIAFARFILHSSSTRAIWSSRMQYFWYTTQGQSILYNYLRMRLRLSQSWLYCAVAVAHSKD